ncbi:MAG: M20 family metallo-hydrolase [Roseiflexaceae bacterium]|nr:M20 family metallo-hydrolase [Roseiflexaceae bacterium]
MPRIVIDPALVERYVFELAEHGAYAATGVWRPAYSPAWQAAQRQLAAWFAQAGLSVRYDAAGNVWGRLAGQRGGPAIVTGSHIDTQQPGGRYDGALGVVAGLVALQAIFAQHGPPRRPIEVVSLCEEEGCRFPGTNFWASRAILGLIDPAEYETLCDEDGISIGAAMRGAGLNPEQLGTARRDDLAAFLELHIEQGPVLEHAGLPVGIVTGVTGLRQYVVEVRGSANHAGAFPMDLRRDAMAGAAAMIGEVIAAAAALGRPAVTTVGRILAKPNYPAIIPERVTFTVDVRHPEAQALAALFARHEASFARIAAECGLEVDWQITLDQPPSPADPALVELLEQAASARGTPFARLHSGAGHDSLMLARIAPMAMIFVQSKDGRSHTPAEFTAIDHAVAGIEILADALYALAWSDQMTR